MTNPIPGWMGHEDVFAMTGDYAPAPGIRRFMTGTPSAIALAAVDAGVALLAEAGMDAVRAKSAALTSRTAVDLADAWLAPYGVEVATPRDPAERGAHVTLRHPDALALTQALTDRGRHPRLPASGRRSASASRRSRPGSPTSTTAWPRSARCSSALG